MCIVRHQHFMIFDKYYSENLLFSALLICEFIQAFLANNIVFFARHQIGQNTTFLSII